MPNRPPPPPPAPSEPATPPPQGLSGARTGGPTACTTHTGGGGGTKTCSLNPFPCRIQRGLTGGWGAQRPKQRLSTQIQPPTSCPFHKFHFFLGKRFLMWIGGFSRTPNARPPPRVLKRWPCWGICFGNRCLSDQSRSVVCVPRGWLVRLFPANPSLNPALRGL